MDSEKLKVAIVLEATLGGTRKHVVDLISFLPSDTFDITFIYSSKRGDDRFKVDIEWFKTSGYNCVELPMTTKLHSLLNVLCILKMIALFKAKKIEVIHLHGAVAGALGRAAALFCKGIRKIVYSPHGGVLHKMNASISSKLYLFIEQLLTTKKVFIVAVSSEEKEKVSKFIKIPSSKIKLIPNGIDLGNLKQQKISPIEIAKERNRLQIANDDFVFLYPALFLEAKGHVHFFETVLNKKLSFNRNIKILLAGDGPLLSRVRELTDALPFREQIQYLGFVKNINLYFQLADAVMLPSVNEAFGYVLIEAMAFEKTIFATNVGGIKDIVENKRTGFLYDVDNLPAMINDMNYYSGHRECLIDIGKNSIEWVTQKFDISQTVGQIKQLYKE